jgi:hypothetical protein
MKKLFNIYRNWPWLEKRFFEAIVLIAILMLLSAFLVSCASSKSKQSSHVTLDSSSKQLEKRDTASQHDSTKLEKRHTKTVQHSDTSHTKEETTIHQVKEVTKYDSSGKVKEYHKTTTDLTKKKDQATGGKLFIEDHSRLDSNDYKNRDIGSHTKSSTTQVHKDIKQESKQKQTRNYLGILWLLLIPVGIWLWKNRSMAWGLLCWALERVKKIIGL